MKHLPFALAPFALAPMALLTALPALAASSDTALPDVVVTASRVPETAANIPASTTVITRQDIEARQSVSLAQLLSLAGGLDVASNGAPGSATSVFMRGTNSNHVLVLIDGVRANTANDGRFDFSLLRPEDIERIEIVRGARSAQYGSDAIGGVIQIFTRKTARNFVAIKAGSFHTQEAQVGVGARQGSDYASLTASYADQDGFTARNLPSNPDRDGQHAKSAQLSAGKRLGEQSMLQFSGIYQDRQVEFDQGVSDEQLSNGRIAFTHDTTANWQQTAEVGYNRVERSTSLTASRLQGSWINRIGLGEHSNLVAGADYQQEEINTGAFGYDKTIQSHGGFIALETALQQLGINLSGRRDEHERFGGHNTGNLTLSYPRNGSLRVYGTLATAFKAPTAEQLYSPGYTGFCEEDGDFDFDDFGPCYVGNPNLKPERSRQRELGVRWQVAQNHVITTNIYDNQVRDLINNAFVFPNSYVNINHARIKGVEVTASGKKGIFSYQLNANSLKAKDDAGADLLRRPRGAFNGLLMVQPNARWSAGTEIVARSHAKDFGNFGVERVPGYTVINLLANWQVTPKLTLGLRADNVTDKQYVQVIGYNTADRSGYVTARYNF